MPKRQCQIFSCQNNPEFDRKRRRARPRSKGMASVEVRCFEPDLQEDLLVRVDARATVGCANRNRDLMPTQLEF